MAIVELIMPKMGESIVEATVINWLKKEGDQVQEDETILEVATDKVDSEVPSPVSGRITKILHGPDEVVAVGKPLALIETDQAAASRMPDTTSSIAEVIDPEESDVTVEEVESPELAPQPMEQIQHVAAPTAQEKAEKIVQQSERFYSPLVRNIAKTESISWEELEQIPGTGPNNRVTKEDLFRYTQNRSQQAKQTIHHPSTDTAGTKQYTSSTISASQPSKSTTPEVNYTAQSGDEIMELDRMRKMIAKHMIQSKEISAHVTSMVEADVTHMVHWRNRVKDDFQKKYGEKITFSPLFAEAVIQSLKDFPSINASLQDDKLIIKREINLGIATALPNGNLIVPVIRNCDELNLIGLTKKLNNLTNRARENKLQPDEIRGGTFTISNIGTFGNIMGTPIINQPELAILAIGGIKKKPVIMETDTGDIIAIRHMMYLSLSYDHRVIDGYLGGSFLKRIADHIENFDPNRKI